MLINKDLPYILDVRNIVIFLNILTTKLMNNRPFFNHLIVYYTKFIALIYMFSAQTMPLLFLQMI